MKLKGLLITFVCLFSQISLAGYNCQSNKGDKIQVISHFRQGIEAKFESKQVSDYYMQKQSISIPSFSTIVDPKTQKFATTFDTRGYVFVMKADAPVRNFWSLSLTFKNSVSAKAMFRALSGVPSFEMDLVCTQTPDLESMGMH